MNEETHDNKPGVEIKLIGKSYRFECDPEDRERLLKAAAYLNAWVAKLPPAEHLSGEKLTAMTALNMAHELLDSDRKYKEKTRILADRIKNRLGNRNGQDQFQRIGMDL